MMLRGFKSISNIARKQPLFAFTLSNKYHYQTELYTSKYQPEIVVNESLKNEIISINDLRIQNPNLYRFIKAYHQNGFKLGNIDPLGQQKVNEAAIFELSPEFYGLKKDESLHKINGLLHSGLDKQMTLEQIENYLKSTYASNMTIEFDFITNEEEKHWIAKEFELIQNSPIENNTKADLLKLLLKSQVNICKKYS